MTPKEKAEELVEGFRLKVLDYDGNGLNGYKAKQCALITVDEVIQAIRYTDAKSDLGYVGYWQEVQQQIQKL